MPRVSAAFFAVGILCVICGMFLGMHMGESRDMTLMPVHAHLNLVGWVTMALFGTFYALTAKTFSPRLAWINFAISTLGAIILTPALALFLLNGNDPKFVPFMIAGEVTISVGAIVFAISVFRELFRPGA